jgi:transposase-like protein
MTIAGFAQPIPLGARQMTRFCMQCDRIIGEKCVRCGTEATAHSNGHAVTTAEFDCPSCGHHFQQGDGGETGGLCTPCLEDQLQKAYVEAAKSQRRRSELAAGKLSRKRLRPISVYRAA